MYNNEFSVQCVTNKVDRASIGVIWLTLSTLFVIVFTTILRYLDFTAIKWDVEYIVS
jgi:hypothetical protein